MKIILILISLLSSLTVWGQGDFTANLNQVKASLRTKITEARTQFPNWNSTERAAYDAQLATAFTEIRTAYLAAYTEGGRTLTEAQRNTLTGAFDTFTTSLKMAEGPALETAMTSFAGDPQIQAAVAATPAVPATNPSTDADADADADADSSEECGPGQVPGSHPCRCVTDGEINIDGTCRPRAECRLPAVIVENADVIKCDCATPNAFNDQRVCAPAPASTPSTTASVAPTATAGSQEALADTFASYDPDSCQWATDLPRKVHSTHSGCNRNGTTSICVGYVVCNVRSGQGQFVRTATCGADKCGASEAKECVKDRSAYSRKPEDVPTKYMSDRVRSLILAQ